MISAQDLIEKVLTKATCDDCIVIVKEKSQANLRWANSTLTTNGVIQERNVTVLAFVSTGSVMSTGGVTRTNVAESEIDSLLEEAISAARAAGPADDYAPLARDLAIGEWNDKHKPTGPEVFSKFAPDLGEMLKNSVKEKIELFCQEQTKSKAKCNSMLISFINIEGEALCQHSVSQNHLKMPKAPKKRPF